MTYKPSKHVFSLIVLTLMGTMKYKIFDLKNKYLERTRRPIEFPCPLIQVKNMLGLHTPRFFGP